MLFMGVFKVVLDGLTSDLADQARQLSSLMWASLRQSTEGLNRGKNSFSLPGSELDSTLPSLGLD